MKRKIVIRRNPFVMLRQLIILEIAIGIIYLIPSFLESRHIVSITTADIYTNIYFTIFAVGIQIVVISAVFTRWYLTQYIINKSKIVIKKNFIANREENYKLENISSITLSQNLFNKISNSGSLIGQDDKGNELFILKDIPEPAYHLSLIEEMQEGQEDKDKFKPCNPKNVKKLLENEEENQCLEFKSSFLWDKKKKEANKHIQHAVMKTIAGFMNTQGGTLLIGVNDNQEIMGLDEDIKNLKKKDKDGFENFFNLVFTNMIGLEFRNNIDFSFAELEGKEICIVNVKPSKKPVYIKNKKNEEFYIRAGNATHPLRISEATRYIDDRFKGGTKKS